MNNNNNKNLLSYQDLLAIKDIIINRFNIEINKKELSETIEFISNPNENKEARVMSKISEEFFEIYEKSNSIDAYSDIHINFIIDKLSKNSLLTTTILNIAHDVSIEISVEEISIEKIYNTLIEGSRRVRLNPSDTSIQCFISKNILSTFFVEEKNIKDILNHNFYLIIINFIISYFHETEIYKKFLTDNSIWTQQKIK